MQTEPSLSERFPSSGGISREDPLLTDHFATVVAGQRPERQATGRLAVPHPSRKMRLALALVATATSSAATLSRSRSLVASDRSDATSSRSRSASCADGLAAARAATSSSSELRFFGRPRSTSWSAETSSLRRSNCGCKEGMDLFFLKRE